MSDSRIFGIVNPALLAHLVDLYVIMSDSPYRDLTDRAFGIPSFNWFTQGGHLSTRRRFTP
jgi:hypothetical protein